MMQHWSARPLLGNTRSTHKRAPLIVRYIKLHYGRTGRGYCRAEMVGSLSLWEVRAENGCQGNHRGDDARSNSISQYHSPTSPQVHRFLAPRLIPRRPSRYDCNLNSLLSPDIFSVAGTSALLTTSMLMSTSHESIR